VEAGVEQVRSRTSIKKDGRYAALTLSSETMATRKFSSDMTDALVGFFRKLIVVQPGSPTQVVVTGFSILEYNIAFCRIVGCG